MGQIYVPYSSSSSSACFIRLSLDTRTGSSDSKLRMSLWRGWDNFFVSKATVLWIKHKINTSSNLFNSILPLKFENVIRESPLYLFQVTWSVPLNSKRLSSIDGALIIEGLGILLLPVLRVIGLSNRKACKGIFICWYCILKR